MKKTTLGHSTLNVTAEGYGCMGLSEFYGLTSEIDAERMLERVIEKGINFLDTADIYGYGHNEKLLGKVLKKHPDDEIILATKCGIVRDVNNPLHREVNNSRDYILSCFERSSERLDRRIDLYYLHRVIQDPDTLREAMTTMHQLRSDGKIGAIGLSEVNAETIKLAHELLLKLSDGEFGLSAVQTEYSLMSRDIENNGVLDTCNNLGISVVAYSPVSRGLLGGKLQDLSTLSENDSRRYLPRFMGSNLKANNAIVDGLRTFAKSNAITPAQISLAWIMNNEAKIIPIPGTRTPQFLDENIQAADITLTPEQISSINDILSSYETAGTRYPEEFMKAYGMIK
ncbi:aldo/keto reductase [Serratia sp. PAMC26656]|uniref:aldo/keto reductase n=1 Tax=Serratia sp. PAMC26656 TaxID=2775909 RepID=UPI0018F5A350|nr:aldo/keto reductase [Serratia sp. PAMC26656]MBJ7891455.1 aldo/keto reductase [Serratia sp. PAMC26656]